MVRPFAFASLGLFCLGVIFSPASCAQDSSSAQSGVPAASASQPPEKKVWTNADVPELREGSPISTVGSNSKAGPADPRQPVANAAKHKDAKWYHDQIEKLQNQLAALNKKIAPLQAAVDGKSPGDGRVSTRPTYAHAGDWQADLAQLQKQRDDIEARINALQAQARRAGIPANALP